MREIKVKVYKFSELSAKAKEKAMDDHNNSDYTWSMVFMEEEMKDKLADLIEENGMMCENAKLYYSLSYCQGDGCMFEGDVSWKQWNIKITHHSSHYHHHLTAGFMAEDDDGNEWDVNDEKEFMDIYGKMMGELEQFGYDRMREEESEEAIADCFEVNEYEFYEDGECYGR